MGITKDRGYFYVVKRVPKRFAHVDPRSQVRRALHTDSEREARAKAPLVEAELMAYWEALATGQTADALAAYDAAKHLAQTRGFSYRQVANLAAGPLDEILTRLEALTRPDDSPASVTEATAILGAVEEPPVTVSGALAEMLRFSAIDRLEGKSDAQKKRWRQPRERAVTNFISVCGDLPMRGITRTNAQEFRDHWAKRIASEGLNRGSANKDIGHLSDLFRTWVEYHALEFPNPFSKLRFKGSSSRTVGVPFSVEFIRDCLLKSGSLDGLNEEARGVLLIMINTGARPSEILGLSHDRFRVDDEIPFLDIAPRPNRQLKTETSPRQIPLLGVSLAAARRIAARGGISRYQDKNDGWSAVVNKFLRENGLRETPSHSAYSLRHSFEDRMTEAGVDDRIRAELMGHKYDRPDYGRGGSLAVRQKALSNISF